MHISENERKVLIIWILAGLVVFLIIFFINIKKKDTSSELPNLTAPGTNYIIDRNRYYTVKNAINKYYSYKNFKDYDSVIKILDEDYVKTNHIDEDSITTYIGESNVSLTFDSKIMCLKNFKSGVYTYVVEGTELTVNTGEEKGNVYYQVVLDGNTSLFSLKPISNTDYKEACNEKR